MAWHSGTVIVRPRAVVSLAFATVLVLIIGGYAALSAGSSRAAPRAPIALAPPEPTPIPMFTSRPSPAQPTRPPIRDVVGLGDSVPAGFACSCTTYVSLVANALAKAQHTKVATHNFAQSGQTTQGLLAQLHNQAEMKALRRADVVIVTIGANDLEEDPDCSPADSYACYRADLRALRPTYVRLLKRIHSLVQTRARVIVTGYWSVFQDGSVARQQGDTYVRNSNALTRAVNSLIASSAVAHAATYVDVYKPFKGDGDRDDTWLLAADGDHPNAAGHRAIAAAIAHTLETA